MTPAMLWYQTPGRAAGIAELSFERQDPDQLDVRVVELPRGAPLQWLGTIRRRGATERRRPQAVPVYPATRGQRRVLTQLLESAALSPEFRAGVRVRMATATFDEMVRLTKEVRWAIQDGAA